jgi:hypothetical protein
MPCKMIEQATTNAIDDTPQCRAAPFAKEQNRGNNIYEQLVKARHRTSLLGLLLIPVYRPCTKVASMKAHFRRY